MCMIGLNMKGAVGRAQKRARQGDWILTCSSITSADTVIRNCTPTWEMGKGLLWAAGWALWEARLRLKSAPARIFGLTA